jgi:hypothetical protein
MKDNLYIVGIPTSPNLVNQELLDFINQNVPTIYLNHLGRVDSINNTFEGYNFFVENNFVDGFLSEDIVLTEEFLSENKVLVPCPGLLPKSRESTTDKLAEKFLQICETIRTKFPTTRIVYVTHGSPHLYFEMIPVLQEVESNFNINIIDCNSFEDSNINNFFKVGVVIGQEMYKPYLRNQIPPYDRSGIFFNNTDITIPSNTYTSKTFSQITDETALSYIGKNVLISWSGGIDSTTAVAAFIKNNVPFKVTVNASAESENKPLYDYLVNNHDVVNIKQNIHLMSKVDFDELNEQYCIVTGDCADQLYPGIHHNFVPGGTQFKDVVGHTDFNTLYQTYFDTPVEEKYLFNNARETFIEAYMHHFKCNATQAENIYDNYLLPYVQQFPFEVQHYYQLRWFFRFIFQYYVSAKEQFYRFGKYNGEVKAFFDTEDYQRWALTNLNYNWNNYSTHYNNYKMVQKQYNYDVLGLDNLLNQTKYPSFY